jgi:hypothetical protein
MNSCIEKKTSNIILFSQKIGKWGKNALQTLYNFFILKGLASKPISNVMDLALIISKSITSFSIYVITSTGVTTIVGTGIFICYGTELIFSFVESCNHMSYIIRDIIVYLNGTSRNNTKLDEHIFIFKKDTPDFADETLKIQNTPDFADETLKIQNTPDFENEIKIQNTSDFAKEIKKIQNTPDFEQHLRKMLIDRRKKIDKVLSGD